METDDSSNPLVESGVSSFSERNSPSDVSNRRLSPRLSPGVSAAIRLLLVQMFERVAYYAITNNIGPYIHIYLHSLYIGQESALLSTVIVGSTWLLSPLYGWLSDSRYGHYSILVKCLAAYLLGVGLIFSSAVAFAFSSSGLAQGLYYSGLCLFALVGSPGIRATTLPFILEQLTAETEQRYSYLGAFVSWSYFFINVGTEIAIMLGGYLQSFPGPGLHSTKFHGHLEFSGYLWRYLLGLGSLLIAICILWFWKHKFKKYRPSQINRPSIRAVFSTACCTKPQRQHFNIDLLRQYEREPGNEDERRRKKEEEDKRRLANLVPFMAAVIVYFMIDSQTESSFVSQGLRMNFGNLFNETILPEDWTYGFDPLGVIITVPVMLYIIKPLYERIAGRSMTMLPQIRWGMIMAALACGLASVVESVRLGCCGFSKTISYVNGKTVHYCHSKLPIYAQIPQYLIIGMSEVLATVGFMEFVLSTSPKEYRCTTFGVLQMMQGIARYLGALFLYVIEESRPTWYYVRQKHPGSCSNTHDRESSPYYYYVILTWMMIINIIFYMIVEFRFEKYVRVAPLERTWSVSG